MAETLIVDLGSTSVAWRGRTGVGRVRHDGAPGRVIVAALAGSPPPRRVVVGSVATAAATAEFRGACVTEWGAEVRLLAADAEALGVRNGYRTPQRLGIDRWAGVVAAFHRHGGPALVADCGTALTVDIVDADGRHRGGAVAPGLGLMRSALGQGTRLQLGSAVAAPATLLGTDTEQSVAAGVHGATAGLLIAVRRTATDRYGALRAALLTGGDASAIRERLDSGWVVMPELVLDGLALLAGEAP